MIETGQGRFVIGGLIVDFGRNVVEGPSGEHRIEPRLAVLLSVLINNAGQVMSREALIEAVWRGAAGADQSLTNAMSQLRKLLADGESGSVRIETVPKRGYRFVGKVTPAPGRANDDDSDGEGRPDENRTPPKGWLTQKRVLASIIGAVIIAAAPLAYLARIAPAERTGAGDASRTNLIRIAVRASGEETQFAYDLGRTIERVFLTNRITTIDAMNPGADDGAAPFLLESIAREESGMLKVHSAVTHLPSGVKLWSREFARSADEAALFQDQIAVRLADILRCWLDERDRFAGAPDTEILNVLLLLCELAKGDGDDFKRLPETARRLVELAPDNAESHAQYGSVLALNTASRLRLPQEEAESRRRAAYASLHRAISIDPQNGRALWGLAIIDDNAVGLADRRTYLRRSLDEDPDFPYARLHMGFFLLGVGRRIDAAAYFKRYVDDFPLDAQQSVHYPRQLLALGQDGFARQIVTPYLERFENARILKWRWGDAEFWYGDADAARSLFEWLALDRATMDCVATFLKARETRTRLSEREIETTCETAPTAHPATYYGYFGHVDRALELLEADRAFFAAPANSLGRRTIFEEFMAPVHADPRFFEFTRAIGLVDYWAQTEEWPDFCRRKTLPYDCRSLARAESARAAGPITVNSDMNTDLNTERP